MASNGWTSEEVDALIARAEKESKEWAEWTPTSWNQTGVEAMLLHAQFLRELASALRACKMTADHGPPGQ